MVNPFIRSTRIRRSPTASESSGLDAARPETPRRYAADSGSALTRLGDQIKNLVDMMEDGKRRSIHQPMRDAIESIRVLYDLYASEILAKEIKETDRKNSATQTSPWMRNQEAKRRQEETVDIPEAKRRTPNPTTATDTVKAASNEQDKIVGADGCSEWQKVTVKKKKKKSNQSKERKEDGKKKGGDDAVAKRPQSKRTKPDAIMIVAEDGSSYADILRKVKTDPKLCELGENVSKIRRTVKGGLLLQLRSNGEHSENFRGAIGELLGEKVSVRTLKERRTIEIKDMDEITEKEDIYAAIRSLPSLGGVVQPDIISLRKAYGGTQTATVCLNADSDNILLKEGKIRIGWVICRVRERITPTKCFRCLQFGHKARQCRSSVDRSRTCLKCGQEGHLAKDCQREPLCMFCRVDRPDSAEHVTGSRKCPIFVSALNTLSRK